jgi:hypothetical protein
MENRTTYIQGRKEITVAKDGYTTIVEQGTPIRFYQKFRTPSEAMRLMNLTREQQTRR